MSIISTVSDRKFPQNHAWSYNSNSTTNVNVLTRKNPTKMVPYLLRHVCSVCEFHNAVAASFLLCCASLSALTWLGDRSCFPSPLKPVSLAPLKTPLGLRWQTLERQITTAQHQRVSRHNLSIRYGDLCDYRPFKVSTKWYACLILAHIWGSNFRKNMTRYEQNSRPAETDPYGCLQRVPSVSWVLGNIWHGSVCLCVAFLWDTRIVSAAWEFLESVWSPCECESGRMNHIFFVGLWKNCFFTGHFMKDKYIKIFM